MTGVAADQSAHEVDVAIVGGGLVGASLAIALQPLGLTVALIESVTADAATQPSFDDRTTALGNGTRKVFESLGLWAELACEAAPITRIHVSDAGRYGFARLEADEHDLEAFGYVITNRTIGAVLRRKLATCTNLELRMPARCTQVLIDEERVRLWTDPGVKPLAARLVVAADGAQSQVRAAAGLAATVEDYEQLAVVAHVTASRAADGTAYERFTPDGPFAVLPLADGNYGVVWTLAPAQAQRVLDMPDAEYLAALQAQFGWRVGRFLRVGKRNGYPLKLTRAAELIGHRVALIGNAAQGLHPVAGQGFNLGLRDAASLAEVLAVLPAGADAGAASVLADFRERRTADREGMLRFTDGLVKLFRDTRPSVSFARDLGLLLFDLSPSAKQALSRVSYGIGAHVPRLARGLGIARATDSRSERRK